MRLTLRTLLAYLDDTLPGEEAKLIGHKVAESPAAQELIEKIKRVTRRRGLSTPPNERGNGSDPNTVAEYLSDTLTSGQLTEFENLCLDSDVHLAEVSACHQILTLLLSEPVRVPPTARQRMYRLVTGPESLPNKKPGNAVPIGGLAPDAEPTGSDDAEMAYLLGMKAYKRTDSRNQRIAQMLLLGGLVAGLALTTYAAWPHAGTDETAQRSTMAVPPNQVNEVPKDKPPEVPAIVAPAVPMPPAVEPMYAEPMAEVPKPIQPPVELAPKPAAPRNDPINVSRFELAERVLLAERNGRWMRVLPKMPDVATAERLLALPGFHCPIKLDTGVQIELWGNLPDLFPIPILESSVTLHVPDDGFDTDFTLHTGRVYLTTSKPAGAKIRVRHANEIWDVVLADKTSDLAIETTRRVVPGITFDVDPSEKPQTTLQLAVLNGLARLTNRHRIVPDLAAGDTVTWSNKGAGFVGPHKLATEQSFSRLPANTTDATHRAILATLAEFAERFKEPDAVRVRLAEMFALRDPGFDETPLETARRHVKPSVAVLAYAAIGELPPAIDGLVDETRPRVRNAAAFGLHSLVAADPDAVERVVKQFADKARLTADQTRAVARLLRGPSTKEKADPRALDLLVDSLNSSVLAIRELAYWQLVNEVDPESRSMKVLVNYDAAAPPLAREGSLNAWKRRVEDLKKKLAEK